MMLLVFWCESTLLRFEWGRVLGGKRGSGNDGGGEGGSLETESGLSSVAAEVVPGESVAEFGLGRSKGGRLGG